MTRQHILTGAAVCALALGACNPQADDADVETRPGGPEEVAADISDMPEETDLAGDEATQGGDGSQIVLSSLDGADMSLIETGELYCAFTADDGTPLLRASGNVDVDQPARGLVKVGDYVEGLVNTSGPGFGAMTDSANFTGQGKTVIISTDGDDLSEMENSEFAAELTYMRADGAERSWTGTWNCGP